MHSGSRTRTARTKKLVVTGGWRDGAYSGQRNRTAAPGTCVSCPWRRLTGCPGRIAPTATGADVTGHA
jgi:hypothetical protein